ncbi:POK6 protein, partial [Onychorhynchus coronatus]|nr:POK6 protein [Onychorhynchus coronatus]
LQRLLGAVNWLRPFLGLTTEELHPLFELLKGSPDLKFEWSLTAEEKQALEVCSKAIENRQSRRKNPELQICLALVPSRFQPFAVLFRWDQAEKDPLRVL